jgi:hypothetical protein
MEHCEHFLLPLKVPGGDLDKNGICSCCLNYDPTIEEMQDVQRLKYQHDLQETLRKTRGAEDYAVNCPLGKDSIYLLYRAAKEYGLRVLAFPIDANIPDVAWASIRKTIEVLQVDHLVYRCRSTFTVSCSATC